MVHSWLDFFWICCFSRETRGEAGEELVTHRSEKTASSAILFFFAMGGGVPCGTRRSTQ
jgi:hypothetical protein